MDTRNSVRVSQVNTHIAQFEKGFENNMSDISPLISIVLPTYNGEKFLAASIESCLNQTYHNWELIIIDDCSTDETPAIINHYKTIDTRIRSYRNSTNCKLPKSLNLGFQHAEGEYLTWTSDDNYYQKDALKSLIEFIINNPQYGLVYSDYTLIDAEGSIIKNVQNSDYRALVKGNCIGPCFLYKREVYEKIGDYSHELFLAEDYDYWLRASSAFQLGHLKENLYFYRQHEGALTNIHNQTNIREATLKTITRNLPILYWITTKDKVEAYRKLASLAKKNKRKVIAVKYRIFSIYYRVLYFGEKLFSK